MPLNFFSLRMSVRMRDEDHINIRNVYVMPLYSAAL